MGFWVADEYFADVAQLLDKTGLPYLKNSRGMLRVTVDKPTILTNAGMIADIASLVRKSWEE